MKQKSIYQRVDWLLIIVFFIMMIMGWLNIYAAVYNEEHISVFDLSQNYGKQLLYIAGAIVIGATILMFDYKFFSTFANIIYIAVMVLLIFVLVLGKQISNSQSWFQLGIFRFQPSEFAKFATALVIARFFSSKEINFNRFAAQARMYILILLPMALVLLQNDTGTAIVFFAFVLVFYREGFSGNLLIIGIAAVILFLLPLLFDKYYIMSMLALLYAAFAFLMRKRKKIVLLFAAFLIFACGFVYSVDYVFDNVLEPHQRTRINVLLGKDSDLKGAGYNINQSKIAIGSGGFVGKGFLQGTQTKYNFVPEQSTDFIFCTIGEEWGFIGSTVLIGLFVFLLFRITFIAERQRSVFSRVYGYGVAAIIFFHFFVNIGMAIGFLPVVGIPLPLFSYGGSSLIGFTILIFILIRLDAQRYDLI